MYAGYLAYGMKFIWVGRLGFDTIKRFLLARISNYR